MIQIATDNTDDALDLLQDSMMKFAHSYSTKPENEWKPLFYKVVQNRIRDWYRREKLKKIIFACLPGMVRKDDREGDPIQNMQDKQSDDSFTKLKNFQALQELEAVLKKLSPRQQQVFLLRAWEGLSIEETAHAMTCSKGSVKTHYSRAVTKLKAQLEGVWP